ncbi:MAG: HEAT repeat domain-containing protein [Desulfobacterales bacterium]
MKLLKNFPFWVAFCVAVVGLIFSILPVVQTSLMDFKEPNKYFLMGISFIFLILGVRYGYLALKGELKPSGISVNKVRKQSLKKIKTPAYLAKIAKEDPDPEVRQEAIKRLEAITNEGNN